MEGERLGGRGKSESTSELKERDLGEGGIGNLHVSGRTGTWGEGGKLDIQKRSMVH